MNHRPSRARLDESLTLVDQPTIEVAHNAEIIALVSPTYELSQPCLVAAYSLVGVFVPSFGDKTLYCILQGEIALYHNSPPSATSRSLAGGASVVMAAHGR